MDLGFIFRPRSGGANSQFPDGNGVDIEALIKRLLDTPVYFGSRSNKLSESGSSIAFLFRSLTSRSGATADALPAPVACAPICVVEATPEDHLIPSANSFLRSYELPDGATVEVYLGGADSIDTWSILRSTDKGAAFAFSRELRSHILNLHTCQESLKRILEAIITVPQFFGSIEANENLQEALSAKINLLTKTNKRLPVGASGPDDVFNMSVLMTSDNEREALLARLEGIRPNLLRRLKTLEDNNKLRAIAAAAAQAGIGSLTLSEGDTTNINITNSSINQSIIGNLNSVQDSINGARASGEVNEELLSNLEELKQAGEKAATELAESGDSQTAEDLSSDLADLAKEAIKKVPRPKRVNDLIDDVKGAAGKALKWGPAVATVLGKLATYLPK